MDLCHCETPKRDATSPTGRLWCAHCGGGAMYGRRLSLEETAHLIGQAQSLLDRILVDATFAVQALYGLQAPPEHNGGGRPKGSHSEPTARIGRGKADDELKPGQQQTPDRWEDASTYLALAAQWVQTAVAILQLADTATGEALYRTDTHRGPADHVKSAYHDTIPTGRPDLKQAYERQAGRWVRGEL